IVDDDEKRKALFSLFTESPAAGVEAAALEKEARARKVAGGQRIQESGQVWTGTGVAQSLDDNMAVALLCSRYIKDTPFEGGLFLHISWVFDRLFDQVERWPLRLGKGTGHDELRRQVARMHELEDNILNQQASTVLSEISQALLNGDSVFLPGGFSGSEGELGHVMAYSISDGYFRIYNTGAGIQYHPGINSPGRNKYDSVLEYKLPPDGIFVDTEGQRSLYPEFEELLLGFMDIRTGNISGDENILYAVIDICMENLGATKSQKISNPSNLTTSQPSGVCATQVFFPIARELVGEDYKFLAIDMRLVALNEFLPRLRKDPGNIAYQKICQEGVRKIAGRLLKQFPTVDSIPPELREKVQQIHRFLDDIRMEVDEISVQQTSSHILPIPEGNASTTVPLGEPIVMKKALPVSTSAEVQASTSLVEEVGVPDLSKGSEGILSWLKQLNTLATRAYDSGDIKTALYYAGEAIRQLPVPKDDYRSDSVWGPTLGEKNALEAMDLLSSLHEMLAGSIDYIRSDSPYGETSLYIVQTYAICYQLARGLMRESSDPERSWLENVSVPTSWPQIFVDRMIGVSSRELLEKREQLTHYLTSTMSSGEYELFGTDRNVFDTSFTFDRCTKRERPKMGGQLLDWTKSPTPSPVSRLFHIGSSIEKLNPDRARPIKIEKSDIYGMGDDNISGNLFLAGSYDEKWHERGSPASELIRRLGSYCSEKEIGLGDIASFFLSEPGAFKELESEPLQNFQALLIRLVNKGADGLSNELVANPACAQNWLELADRGWKRALQPPQNIANALFFFHIRERVLSALEGVDDAKRPLYTNEQIQGLRRRSYEELMQLATTHPPPKTEELAAIHREILCMQDRVEWTGISGKTSEEKLEWLERVLPSLCMLNLHSAIGVFANIKMLDIEARHFRRLAAQPIITRLLDEPRAIEKYGGALTSCVVQAFGVKTEDVGDWKQIGPGLWRAGKYTIEPATGNLYEEGESVCSLPRNVIDGCDPPWIFGEEQPLARVLAQGRGYEWTSRFGGIERTFRAIKESRGAGFQLQMFGGGERGWLKLTSLGKKEMESLAEHSPLLAESGSFYYWTSDSTLVFTDKSGCHYAEWFASSAEQPEWCIRKLEADGTRTNWLLDCGFAGRMAYASTLDRAEYTHHWIDGKGGEELDYTRMAGMTWEKQKSGEWSCDLDGVPMRLITEKEEIPKVNLSFPHMLFAKGAKGSQKRYAFICEGAFMECPKGEQQLFPQRADRTPLAWDEQSEQHGFPSMGSQGYYRFDIEPDGSLSSNTVEGNLFLLYLALGEGNHEQALRYLKACGHPSYLSQEAWSLAHKVIVDSEETIKDHTPEASALVLQLYDWLKLIASKPLKSGLQEQTEQSTRESSHALVDAEYRKARSLDACGYFFDFLSGQGIFPNEVVSSAALERVLGGMEGVESSIAERENDYIESLRYQRPPFALDQDQMMRLGMTWPMEEVCEPDLT
ncbi:MAG: hypothetical protein ACE5GN_01855, partial [Waddliaceae bacterium]